MSNTLERVFRRLYDLYAGDLQASEMERLVKRDAPGVYDFYVRDVKAPDQKQDPFTRFFSVSGSVFLAFLNKLTPVRRMFYSLVALLFVYGLFADSWMWGGVAFLLLNVLLAFELADKLIAKDELEVAREIQMNLMPQDPPTDPHFDIACFSEPAREVGGDYYDFVTPERDQDSTYVVIADVSGKGMGAALHMVQVQAMLHHVAEQYTTPAEILKHLNRHLKVVLRKDAFLTISIAELNGKKSFKMCRAGHMPLIHFQKKTGECRDILPGGIGIGLPENGQFDKELEQKGIRPASGDVLVLYTDGIVEAMDSHSEFFGDERLRTTITLNSEGTANEIQDSILTALARFRGSTAPHDDLTLIVLKVK